ncbi:uncharacterized protein LOC119450885 [Dermacentor silvarum]|uniref:uncharacterized protein LOC119450885 n=1 Tax=Dermacentor silvarum TaxID=543639 RepID=UPI00189B9006|nr:uncharacterized protein LOC119450885 [Dermacentor silvarum]
MTFFMYGTVQHLNYVNSTIVNTSFGYSLSPPYWRFWYANENCSVVRIPFQTPVDDKCEEAGNCPKPLCELWVSRDYNGTVHKSGGLRNATCCEVFFESRCNTTIMIQVYSDDVCLHKEESSLE